ncbi:MAG: hypothetical protein GY859_16175 [Desulfobacterales bacterium]|nr:hypothetical protein [Desulfobacterales bacterium]
MFADFNTLETFFVICALIGGLFVIFRLVMQFVGLGHHEISDFDAHGHDMDAAGHTDSDFGFKILSLNSFTSFLMMFGLVGLALYRQSHMGGILSLAGAIAAGMGSVWVIGKMFLFVNKLQSSGTISIDSAVGARGKVYMTIPKEGVGRVLINISDRLREYDAATNEEDDIPTGTPIRVIWIDGDVLVVEKI